MSPESITTGGDEMRDGGGEHRELSLTAVVMDSGLALHAPRNDDRTELWRAFASAREGRFRERHQADAPFGLMVEDFSFFFSEIMFYCRHPVFLERGASRSSRNVGRGMRWLQ
ncbi:MAG: hypothetical protein WA418_13250 [Bradyrhizobium sp.]